MSTGPPPLAPMKQGNKMTTKCSTTAENQPLGMGTTLASSLTRKDDSNSRGRHQVVCLEDHVENGIGVHEDDVTVSSMQQDFRTSTTARPKRTSLIERSREFKEKFVQFMNDYDDEQDKIDKKSCVSDVDLDKSNRFPTRDVDLRHVDQGINLMDASSARFEWREDCEEAEAEVDVYYGDEDYIEDDGNYNEDDYQYDDEDVYAGYTTGYSSANTEEPAIAGCGGVARAMDNKHREVVKVDRLATIKNRAKPISCDWGWWGFALFMFALAVILLGTLEIFHGSDDSSVSSSSSLPPMKPEPPMPANAHLPEPAPGSDPVHSNAEVAHRHHVLNHIVNEELIKASHAAVLNPSHPSAKKAFEWMTTYDAASMKLLDEFDFHPKDEPEQSDKLRKAKDIDAPSNHATKIVDRYVEVVFYFESHPHATPKTAVVP